MKNLTDFRKTVETDVDPRLLFPSKISFPLDCSVHNRITFQNISWVLMSSWQGEE